MHHNHKQVFGLKDWAVAGMRDPSRMSVMPFTPTVLLYGPAPIHLCYLLINTKPHWRMPPFQLPEGPPQPLLSVCSFTSALPTKVFHCWITEMICIKDEKKVNILPGVECGSQRNQVHRVLLWSMGVNSPRLGKDAHCVSVGESLRNHHFPCNLTRSYSLLSIHLPHTILSFLI